MGHRVQTDLRGDARHNRSKVRVRRLVRTALHRTHARKQGNLVNEKGNIVISLKYFDGNFCSC